VLKRLLIGLLSYVLTISSCSFVFFDYMPTCCDFLHCWKSFFLSSYCSQSQDAISNFSTEQEIATAIKAKIESQFPSTWHCFVGRNFGSFVTHESSRFIYFYIGQMGICLFATA